MNILVIGGGGREHALVWKLSQSKDVDRIYCAPGNAGIARLALTEGGDFAGARLGIDDQEVVARQRRAVEAENLDRSRRTGLLHLLRAIVDSGTLTIASVCWPCALQ